MFFKPFRQRLADNAFNRRTHFGGDQLVLGLGGEFRVRHLGREHAGQAFAGVIAGDGDFRLRCQSRRGRIAVDDTRQRAAESGQMGAAIALRDVVGEAENILVIAVIPLQRRLDHHTIALALDQDRLREDRGLGAIKMGDEGCNAALIDHGVGPDLVLALIAQGDLDARIQEGELAQTVLQRIAVKFGHGEGFFRRHEAHFRARLARIDIAHHLQVFVGNAVAEAHMMLLALAPDRQVHPDRQGIDHRNAHPVQTAGDLVGILVELPAGMQLGHDDLGRRHALALVEISRNTATVIAHTGRAVGMQRHQDFGTMAGEGFVDRVVDDLINHVVQARAVIGITDIHAWTFADSIKALEDLDRFRVVFVIRLFGHGVILPHTESCGHTRAHA